MRNTLIPDQVQILLGELLITLDEYLLGFRIHDIAGSHTSNDIFKCHRDMLHSGGLHLADHRPGQLSPLFRNQLVRLRVPNIPPGLEPHNVVGFENHHRLFSVKDHGIGLVEIVNEVFGGHSKGAEQHRDGEFSPAVDAHVQDIPWVKFKIEPGTTVGYDPGRIQELAAGMGFPLVVLEENPRRTMELTDDDTLGAIHHERTILSHQRDLAKIDFLLLDVSNAPIVGLGIHIPQHHLNGHLKRCRVGHAALVTILNIIFRLAETVTNEFQGGRIVKVFDGENRLKDSLESYVLTLVWRNVFLHKEIKGVFLDLDQIRKLKDFFYFSIIAPEP